MRRQHPTSNVNLYLRLCSGLMVLAVIGVTFIRLGPHRRVRVIQNTQNVKVATQNVTATNTNERAQSDSEDRYDADPEEREAASEELQAVSDGSLSIEREEMAAYWRLLHWVTSQSSQKLDSRAAKDVTFNDLMQRSHEHRGQLLAFDLNVRRILSYDAPKNDLGIEKLYELWGWTDQSKAWLYVCVTPELPEGLQEGETVNERVRFAGYFFKLQGYLEANAPPRAKPLNAPLCLGHVIWTPKTVPGTAKLFGEPSIWGLTTAGAIVAVVTLMLVICFKRSRANTSQLKPSSEWIRNPK